MSFVWKPAVYDAGGLYRLPRPVTSLSWQDSWDFDALKVLLAEGDELAGLSRGGIEIRLEGQIGSHDGDLQLTEQAMFTTLETLRNRLNASSDGAKYEFFLYHDDVSATYRKFKSASTGQLECDLSDVHLFTYSVAIHADDPTLYTTAPGV
jgi:hypothetical protein